MVSYALFNAGIGPEISQSIKDIYTAAKVGTFDKTFARTCANRPCLPQVPIQWEEVDVTPILVNGKTAIPKDAIDSVKKNTVALKGQFINMDVIVVSHLS